jgi:transcription-repair coupling factor (superfamily II helicase)
MASLRPPLNSPKASSFFSQLQLQQKRGYEMGGLSSAGAILLVALEILKHSSSSTALFLFATEEDAERASHAYEVFQPEGKVQIFPFWDYQPFNDALFSEGLSILKTIGKPAQVLFISLQALLQRVPSPQLLRAEKLKLKRHHPYSREEILTQLQNAGFLRTPMVGDPGEFAVRGEILDIFPFSEKHPYRLEFFGEELEEIRSFEVESQLSIEKLSELHLSLIHRKQVENDPAFYSVLDYLQPQVPFFQVDPDRILERIDFITQEMERKGFYLTVKNQWLQRPHFLLYPLAVANEKGYNFQVHPFSAESPEEATQQVHQALKEKKTVYLTYRSKIEKRKLLEWMEKEHLEEQVQLQSGILSSGFSCEEFHVLYLPYHDLFHQNLLSPPLVPRKKSVSGSSSPIQEFMDLKPGEWIVHIVHGIGKFEGVHGEYREGILQDFIYLKFADDVILKLPATSMALVQKYIQGGTKPPKLDQVGSKSFQKRMDKVRLALHDVASELMEIQALRDQHQGVAYPADTEWQEEFEEAFPYELTLDQKTALKAIKEDMESPRPMDRLLCGDVGFGKTELAIRAIFKAVLFNKQVAVLAPTSILARQHYLTMKSRMAGFPIEIAYVSKLVSPQKQKDILEKTKTGQIDILIGTHRILSADVSFKNLGFVVIDEEQRFGVVHKEKLKKIRATLEVLTLTATPIPRTLNSALMGIRDISVLTTPPRERRPIISKVLTWESSLIRKVILEEKYRGGQVFFVHNRVETIGAVTEMLRNLVPEVRFTIVHGQLPPKEIEEQMSFFLERGSDVLVCTSIIESGIDIPNANTIIINSAEHFGLAELHQLRGRVGRYIHQAYAYFIIKEHAWLTKAQKRVKVMEEFSQLGAGFKISMKDLELRGAGNLMGYEQSGHIASIGYELYCQILKETVALLKKQRQHYRIHPNIKLNISARIPESYIPDISARMTLYRKLSSLLEYHEYLQAEQECLDRYGSFPEEVLHILWITRLRIHAEFFGFLEIYEREGSFFIHYQDLQRLKKGISSQATIRYLAEQRALCCIDPQLPLKFHLDQLFFCQAVEPVLETSSSASR